MKTKLPALVLLNFMTLLVIHADVIIYNQNNPPDATDLPSGGWGTYRGISLIFNDGAFTTGYTGTDSAPLPATLYLTDLTIRRAGTTGTSFNGDPQNAYLKIYSSQSPGSGTWLGDSTNTGDMRQGISEDNVTFSFNNLELSSSTKYFFYFANTLGDGSVTPITWTDGRLRVSNNANVTYSSGNLFNTSFGNQDTAYDAVFVANFVTVPEPSSIILMGILMGASVLVLRGRRR